MKTPWPENKLRFESPSLAESNLDKIGAAFPEVITESRGADGRLRRAVDFEKLRGLLGEEVAVGDEAYQFTWVGKNAAMWEAGLPIRKTLRPCVEESKDWDATENLYIEGDNLEALKLLQECYLGKVKMIYIDPPYNTGNDFVYRDDFAKPRGEYDTELGVEDEETGNQLFRNTESNGRFHSDWCSMIYPRLHVARDFLANDGIIFISIDDNEVAQMRKICDEVFGTRNFVGQIVWKKKTNGNNMGVIPPVHDYIISYCKSIEKIGEIGYEMTSEFFNKTYSNPDNDPRGVWTTMDLSANHKGPYFPITNSSNGEVFYPSEGRYWVFNEREVERRIKEGRIIFGKTGLTRPVQKVFAAERLTGKRRAESWWDNHGMNEDATTEIRELLGQGKLFTHPKPSKLLYHLVKIATNQNSIILDFFSGSATTAHAVMQLNAEDDGQRKFIMIQLPEKCAADSEAAKAGFANICEIGKERIRRAGAKIGKGDTGFRVLKVADSNMKDVYYNPAELPRDLLSALTGNIKEDRTDLDLLYGCLLAWGLPLSLSHTRLTVGGCTVHDYDHGALMACFDANVSEDAAKQIAALKPLRAVFRDVSFSGDAGKTSVGEIFKVLSPGTEVKVL